MLANLAFLMEYSLRLQCNFMSNNLNFTAVLNKSLLDCKFSCFSVPFVGKIQNSSRYCIETACWSSASNQVYWECWRVEEKAVHLLFLYRRDGSFARFCIWCAAYAIQVCTSSAFMCDADLWRYCAAAVRVLCVIKKYDFIWPNKTDWAITYIYCTKKHYQRKQGWEMAASWFVEALQK